MTDAMRLGASSHSIATGCQQAAANDDDEGDGLIASGPRRGHRSLAADEGLMDSQARHCRKYSRSIRSCMCLFGTCLLVYVALSVRGLQNETVSVRAELIAYLREERSRNDDFAAEVVTKLASVRTDRFEDVLAKVNSSIQLQKKHHGELKDTLLSHKGLLLTQQTHVTQLERSVLPLPKHIVHIEQSIGPLQKRVDQAFMPRTAPPKEHKVAEEAGQALPMVKIFGADVVGNAIAAREKWFRELLKNFDLRDDNEEVPVWSRYDNFGPVYSLCPAHMLQSYGAGDKQTMACQLAKLAEQGGACEIVSIGSNGTWGFEREVFQRTGCKIHAFDCRGDYQVPKDLSARVFSYKKCIGTKEMANSDYLPYDVLLKIAEIRGKPTYLKIDAEGFEWNVFPGILGIPYLPDQIAFEIHYHKLEEKLGWRHPFKTQAEIALFGEMMFQAGYLPIHRRDNTFGARGEAAEYLMARVARRAGS